MKKTWKYNNITFPLQIVNYIFIATAYFAQVYYGKVFQNMILPQHAEFTENKIFKSHLWDRMIILFPHLESVRRPKQQNKPKHGPSLFSDAGWL